MVKKILSVALALMLILSIATPAFADGTEPNTEIKGYLVLGEDLTTEQHETVLDLLNVDADDLDSYVVSYGTNEQEHEAFDSYLSQSIIGTKALSSILMVPADEGAGISITTYNISYCTVEMYQNALISAGVEDVDVYIAAPYAVSGTCALVGAMNAYATLTGVEITEETTDAAANELVTTGEIGEAIDDNDTAAELVAALKQQVAESDEDMTEDELAEAVDNVCVEFKITLDDDLKQELITLLQKLQETDLDADSLKEQASDLYDKVSEAVENLNAATDKLEATSNQMEGILQKITAFFKSIGDWISAHVNTDSSDNNSVGEISSADGSMM